MNYFAGIDIGGSNIKCALTDECNSLLSFASEKTNKSAIAESVANILFKSLNDNNIEFSDLSSIGMGVPGIVEGKNGPVVYAPNLDMIHADLVNDFSVAYKNITGIAPDKNIISLCNDADCAGVAEATIGAGKDYENILLLTLGTGVGGSAIYGKKPLPVGKYGGEFGHFPFVKDGKECPCGIKGCFEQYANAKASHELPFDEYTDNLSLGICGYINILRPDIVVLAGGVTNEGQRLFDALNKKISSLAYAGKIITPPKVVCAALGDRAGATGAALFGKSCVE